MKRKNKFRLGIIGAGIFAEANIYPSLSLHFFDDVTRGAVCDINESRAKRLADKYGWKKVYTDYKKMLKEESIDGVILVTGAKTHPIIAPDILKAGFPLFLEKPSSIDLKGTRKIAAAAEKYGQIVQVGRQKRFGLAYNRARKLVFNKKSFGNIIQIESKMHGFPVFPTFYTCMLEWQCHNLDLISSFGGEIKSVSALSRLVTERTGALSALIEFQNGIVGTLNWGTFGGPGPYAERLEIIGDKGRGVIVTNAREVTIYQEDTGEVWSPDWNPISKNQSHVFNGYAGELRAFIDSVKHKRAPVPSIKQEEQTMRWLTVIAKKAGIPIEWAHVDSAL